jgi:hypothetical protein
MSVFRERGTVLVTIDDDGQGIAADQRAAMRVVACVPMKGFQVRAWGLPLLMIFRPCMAGIWRWVNHPWVDSGQV